jgi:hypothetical protein
MSKAKQDVYLDADGNAVPAGPDARKLLVRAGQEIPEDKVKDIEGAEALIGAAATKEHGKKGDSAKDLEKRKSK